ncbi:MAG: hypothetical protein WD749_15045 [Phycisphaerales bacterium]
MLDWAGDNGALLTVLAGASVIMFVASLFIIPAVAVRIPADYFAHERRPPGAWAHRSPLLRLGLRVVKNAMGLVLIAAGIAMLVLPGQGLLTMLIGFLMIDFPGKYRAEKWLISRPRMLRGINWLRARSGRGPLRVQQQGV